jgi:hypothetical protein
MTQRALIDGTSVLGTTRQVVAGEMTLEAANPWKRIAGVEKALSTEFPAQAGVYTVGEQTLAVNRSAAEDGTAVLAAGRIKDDLFKDLDLDIVEGQAGSAGSLAQEIWRMFVMTMMAAMILEAALCLPKRRKAGEQLLWDRPGSRHSGFARHDMGADHSNGQPHESPGTIAAMVPAIPGFASGNGAESSKPLHPHAPPVHRSSAGGLR